jgi:DNA-directed RNA polymerase specialized sigma subunit
MENTYCIGCDFRELCVDPCEELRAHLKEGEWDLLGKYSQLSTDYMDKVFPDQADRETDQENERRLAKERKDRGKAINKLVAYFGRITGEEGKSLKYYFVWKLYNEEMLTHTEIAEILDVSRPRISQMLLEIKGSN